MLIKNNPRTDAAAGQAGDSDATSEPIKLRCLMVLTALLAILLSAAAAHPALDDEALDRLLHREPRFAVCIWSPHMPLSVDAVAQVLSAGRALGVPIVAVLDPRADRAYAAAAATAAKLPDDVLRLAQATRLMRADAFQHVPTLVVFAGGSQAGAPIVGYLDAAEYQRRLRERFAEVR